MGDKLATASTLQSKTNLLVISSSLFLLTFVEGLWVSFLPKYLREVGAAVLFVGLYGTVYSFLSIIYRFPGLMVKHRLSAKKALVLFTALGVIGYIVYFLGPTWQYIYLGVFFVAGFATLARGELSSLIPATGELKKRLAGTAFQGAIRGTPLLIGPVVGGLLILKLGFVSGVKVGMLLTAAVCILLILIVVGFYSAKSAATPTAPPSFSLVKSFNRPLKGLLISDSVVRTAEMLPSLYVVLYAINIVKINAFEFGILVAVQTATPQIVQLLHTKLSSKLSAKMLVTISFLFASAYPFLIVSSKSFLYLLIASVMGGISQIGARSKNQLMEGYMEAEKKSAMKELYTMLRELIAVPASFLGGVLWSVSPGTPFQASLIIGLTGTALFAALLRKPKVTSPRISVSPKQ